MTKEELLKFHHDTDRYDPFILYVDYDDKPFLGLFDCVRIPDEKVPDGCFRYSIREDDEGCPITIEPEVYVNHCGDIIVTREIDFKGQDSLDIWSMEWGLFEYLMTLV